jgi:hypothetical protein
MMTLILHFLFGHEFELIRENSTGTMCFYKCYCGRRGIWTEDTKQIFYSPSTKDTFKFEGE